MPWASAWRGAIAVTALFALGVATAVAGVLTSSESMQAVNVRCIEWNFDHNVGKPNQSIYVEWEDYGHRPDPTRNRHMHWCAELAGWEHATSEEVARAMTLVHSHPWPGSTMPVDETEANQFGRQPSRSTTSQIADAPRAARSVTSRRSVPVVERVWLDVTLTVSQNPAEVGQTLTYTVTARNAGSQPLTGVTWRDTSVDPAAAWQSLGDLAVGASTTASGSFGLLRADHIPHVIVTIRVDSDQTGEVVVSRQVSVEAATTEATSQQASTVDLSGQLPVSRATVTRVPPTLQWRVVRVLFAAPDVHLAHNIPDLLLTLPDGSETSCNFLTHYESTGALARWGHAISEVLEEYPGTLTQYYQGGVVDCREDDDGRLVERRPAWDYVGGGVEGAPDLGVEPHLLNDQPGDLHGPWGHRVSDYAVDGTFIGFYAFFTTHGGVKSFGYPKTEARYDNDPRAVLNIAGADSARIRQYFEAAVLEHHTDDPARPVRVYLLGHAVRDRLYPNQRSTTIASFGPAAQLTVGDFYAPERLRLAAAAAPSPPSTAPAVPPVPRLDFRVGRVLHSSPDRHLAHNIPDLTLTLPDGSEQRCDFLSYYEATHGLARWGHAISEVLVETPGTLTQYYQRGVVDCYVSDGEYLVERRLTWDYIGGGVEGAPDLGVEPHLLNNQPGDLHGPWGHRVSDYAVDGTFVGFYAFFTTLGGVNSLGYPKTEARYDNDPRAVLGIVGADSALIRQYFQAAVLEHYPEDPARPSRIYLLGYELRDRRYPAYGAFVAFGPFGPLTQGQRYYPISTSTVYHPAG